MFRLLFVTFYGSDRVAKDKASHIHRPSAWMRVPLVVLAVLSILGGLVGIPIVAGGNRIGPFLSEVVHDVGGAHAAPAAGDGHAGGAHAVEAPAGHGAEAAADAHGAGHDVGTEMALMGLSVLVALAGIGIAYATYIRRPGSAEALRRSPIGRLVARKYLIDEFYDWLVVRPLRRLSNVLWQDFDVVVIDGLVNGSGKVMRAVSGAVRLTQNGQAQTYLVSMILGSAVVIVYLVLR